VLNGPAKVSLIFPNLAPTQQVFGFMQQTAGSAWSWFATEVRFPPILISL
jgi:hypothetical protein